MSRSHTEGKEAYVRLFLTLALNGVDGQRHALVDLPRKMAPEPIVEEVAWAQD